MTTHTDEDPFPFLVTHQYRQFQALCEAVGTQRSIGLVDGAAGTGKSRAAQHSVHQQARRTVTGQAPILYTQLTPADMTAQALYSRLLAALAQQTPATMLAKVAGTLAAQWLEQRGYALVIIDEAHLLRASGWEALRVLWDALRIALILIVQTPYLAGRQRSCQGHLALPISAVLHMLPLTLPQIKQELLPQRELLAWLAGQERGDDEQVAHWLYTMTHGDMRRLRFLMEAAQERCACKERGDGNQYTE